MGTFYLALNKSMRGFSVTTNSSGVREHVRGYGPGCPTDLLQEKITVIFPGRTRLNSDLGHEDMDIVQCLEALGERIDDMCTTRLRSLVPCGRGRKLDH